MRQFGHGDTATGYSHWVWRDKKLQDLFTDLQVPRYWRERVPLLDCKRGIAWVVGHRIADWAKVNTDSSGLVLWLRFTQSED